MVFLGAVHRAENAVGDVGGARDEEEGAAGHVCQRAMDECESETRVEIEWE